MELKYYTTQELKEELKRRKNLTSLAMTRDNKTSWDRFLDEHHIYKTGYVIDEIDVADAFEAGRNDVINEACEWLRNNWRDYVDVDSDGVVCFGHWENDFRKAMKGDRDND